MHIKQQLALNLSLNNELTLKEFSFYGNEWLEKAIHPLLAGEPGQFIYVWGATGCGKSHFLQALCNSINQKSSAIYLPLQSIKTYGIDILEGLDSQDLICLDDVDAIATDICWEEAIFHFYNKVKQTSTTNLVVSAALPAKQTALALPDLVSRLTSGLTIMLKELNDESKRMVLSSQAAKRGFELTYNVGEFLLTRVSRNMHELQQVLDILDKESLRAKRKITIPFVKNILNL